MRRNLPLLVGALLVSIGSAGITLMALERGSIALVIVAAVGMAVSACLFVLSIWLPRRRVDWDRIEAEQRLWESGPLGRSWLRVRRRLSNLWKV